VVADQLKPANTFHSQISYWLACYPLDVVKSRVQLRDAPVKGLFYITDELAAIVKEGGTKALFKGLSPSLLRSIPAAAATFATFELTRDFLRKITGV
jgi:solute carrier family 25 (mitochondrial carnitine/acylcarnitine transporter), member 20/29